MTLSAPAPRQEYEVVLEPLLSVPLERELPLGQRLWQHGWLRKSLILVLLALAWEAVARYQGNDLLLPSFLQTSAALAQEPHQHIPSALAHQTASPADSVHPLSSHEP